MQVKKDQIQKVNLGPWLQEVNDEIQNGNRVCMFKGLGVTDQTQAHSIHL